MQEFEAIFKEYNTVVFRFLLSLCGDESLAEELTSETFYQAYLHIGMSACREKLAPYIFEVENGVYDLTSAVLESTAEEADTCIFTAVSAARRYKIICEGLAGAAITVSDGRTISFWKSFIHVVNGIFGG